MGIENPRQVGSILGIEKSGSGTVQSNKGYKACQSKFEVDERLGGENQPSNTISPSSETGVKRNVGGFWVTHKGKEWSFKGNQSLTILFLTRIESGEQSVVDGKEPMEKKSIVTS